MTSNTPHKPATGDVIVLATLDTKGREAGYVRDLLVDCGVWALLADAGSLAPPAVKPDIGREEIFSAAGADAAALGAAGDRGAAVSAAARGAAAWAAKAHRAGRLAGILAIGGSAGTTIGTAAMRALPIGVPKVMVSTLASGQVRHYVGDKDIVMLNSIVDLAGLNRVTREVLGEAARAMAGMIAFERPASVGNERPLVAATMFGVTTPCIEYAREVLEHAGCEVLVFHATGSGGQAMESLIDEGLFAGVLDITTTELADEVAGGLLSAGRQRLTAAGRRGIPQVVSVGATDMVNFHAPQSVPERFAGRTIYHHNPHVTLMRTTCGESVRIGADIGCKLAAARGPVAVYLPARGVSAIDRAGQPFDDPVARQALFAELRRSGNGLEIHELDCHLNDRQFAEAAARRLLEFMRQPATKT